MYEKKTIHVCSVYSQVPCLLLTATTKVFIATTTNIYLRELTPGSSVLGSTYSRIPLQNLRDVLDVDFDPVEGRLYWSDWDRFTISRAFLDGSDQEVISNVGEYTGKVVETMKEYISP